MGVHDLWKLLDPAKRSFRLEELEGKVLAIDASIWLNQFIKAISDDKNKGANVPLKALLGRIFKLFYYGIKPVFVFDGYTPDIKKRTTMNRRKTREKSKEEAEKSRQLMVLQKFILESRKNKGLSSNAVTLPNLIPRAEEQGDEEAIDLEGGSTEGIEFVEVGDWISEGRPKESEEKGKEKRNPIDIEEEDDAGGLAVLSTKPSPKSRQSEMLRNRLENFPFDRKVLAELPLEIQEEVFAEYERLKTGVYNEFDVEDANLTDFSSLQLKSIVVQGNVKRKMRDSNDIIRQQALKRRIASDESAKYVLIEEIPVEEPDPLADLPSELLIEPSNLKAQPTSISSHPHPSTSSPKKRSLADHSMSSTSLKPRTPTPSVPIHSIDSEEEPLVGIPSTQIPNITKGSSFRSPAPLESDSFDSVDWVDEPAEPSRGVPEGLLPASASNPLDALFPGIEEKSREVKKIYLPLEPNTLETSFDRVLSNVQSELKPIEIGSSFEALELSPSKIPKNISSPPPLPKASPSLLKKVSILPTTSPIPILDSSREEPQNIQPDLVDQSSPASLVSSPKPNTELAQIPPPSDNTIMLDPIEKPIEQPPIPAFPNEPEVDGLQASSEDLEDDDFAKEPEEPSDDDERPTFISNEDELSDYELEQRRKSHAPHSEVVEIADEEQGSSVHPFFVGHSGVDENLAVNEQLFRENIALNETAERKSRQAKSLSEQLLADTKALLICFGIPFIVSPAEADSQCAELERLELVDGIISDDSDMFVFGAKNVFRNCFSQAKDLFHYNMDAVHRICALDQDDLISLAQLLGSDYAQGVNGVGIVLAMEIIAEFRGPTSYETLVDFRDWLNSSSKSGFEGAHSVFEKKHGNLRKKLSLRSNFPEIEVEVAYKKPDVNSSTEKFSWAEINISESKRFFEEKFNWDEKESLGKLKPILDKLEEHRSRSQNGLRQQSLGAYFAPKFISIGEGVDEETLARKIKSKRFLQVVKKLQRLKQGLPVEETVPEKDVGAVSKPKKKRGPRKKKSKVDSDSEHEGSEPIEVDEGRREETPTEPPQRKRGSKRKSDAQEPSDSVVNLVEDALNPIDSPPKPRVKRRKPNEAQEEKEPEVQNGPTDPSPWLGRFRAKRPGPMVDPEDSTL